MLTQTPEGEYRFWLSRADGEAAAAGGVQGAGPAGRDGAIADEPGGDGAGGAEQRRGGSTRCDGVERLIDGVAGR